MINLSNKQKEIVDHIDGAILVKAGPGSGKTRVLIERIKHLLLTQKRCKVLALTFSNLAAEEMRNRIQDDTLIDDFLDNITIGTIHSFCLDLVQARGNLIGLGDDMVLFESIADQQSVLRDVFVSDPQLQSILRIKEKPNVFLQECLGLISEQKKKFILPELCKITDPFPAIYREYQLQLSKQNALDFDDILFYAYRILAENPAVVKLYTSLYKYICVDESQDLNFAQYEVIKALCGRDYKNIMFVGDENQSIYGFNGSDSSLMSCQFVQDFHPTTYSLNENYRSAKAIVDYANKLKNYESTANYVYNGELLVNVSENETAEAEYVVTKITNLISNGHVDIENPLNFDDFAIIARNKYVLSRTEEALLASNIPFFYKKTTSGIDNESEYMKVFELCVRILINSRDSVHLMELCKIVKCDNIIDTKAIKTDDAMEVLKRVLVTDDYSKIMNALSLINNVNFDFNKVLEKLKADLPEKMDDDDRYLTINDLEQWKKHWGKYIQQVQRENRTLLSFRNYISLGKTQDIIADKGVALLTVHMSKGLQYEVVFVIGLSEGTLPDYRAIKSGDAELEQEKNNMYVAVTRAKRLCYLSYPKLKMMPWRKEKRQCPSRFLQDILDMKS